MGISKLSSAQQGVVNLMNDGWIMLVRDSYHFIDKNVVHLERRERIDNSGWYRITGRVWVHPSTFSVLVRKCIIVEIDGDWVLAGAMK